MFTVARLIALNKPDIDFIAPLSIDKCQILLADEVKRQSDTLWYSSDKPIEGETKLGKFTITPKAVFFSRGFEIPTFYGRLVWTTNGTQVVGYFAPHHWHVLSWLLASLIVPLIERTQTTPQLSLLFVCILIGGIQWVIVRLNHGRQQDVRKFLVELLRPTN